MRKILLLALISVGFMSELSAQTKDFTLEEIWGGAFRTKGMEAMRSMSDDRYYTVLNSDRNSGITTIDQYEYAGQTKVGTLVSSAVLPDGATISSYEWSADGKRILLGTAEESIYRHSVQGYYFVYDLGSKKLWKLSGQKIQEPLFSPAADKVAYVENNNIFIYDLGSSTVTQVTRDGERNRIINGITDWVYEEEFSFVRAFDWNADGSYLAYLRFDETEVPEFSMDIYGEALYPSRQVFKYPKAGEANSVVELYTYNVQEQQNQKVDLQDAYYLPRLMWTNKPGLLSVQVLNRHQNHLKLVMHDVKAGTTRTVLEEQDKAYVDIHDHLSFLKDNSFIWTSEAGGYNHLYHYTENGKLIRQITNGPWEVTAFYGLDAQGKYLYYQSVENGSINRDIYRIGLNGKGKQRLSKEEGTHRAIFSSNKTYYIDVFSSANTPVKYTLHQSVTGKPVREIVNNESLLGKLKDYAWSPKEFSTIEINGEQLNMWMIKPADFDPSKTYPLLMYQYSGPGSQNVSNSWMQPNDYWYQLLAQKGFIVACVDGRGTGFKGAEFKKMTYLQLGKYEVQDQIEVARKLGALDYIDASRIGIWGWSYGGFMSTNCLLQGADVFAAAIAVAPVISWRFYDSVYTERYMRTPQENPEGYDQNSPLSHAQKLKGDYLLIHGSGDDNVHVQNTMRMLEALIQADKNFDSEIYPDKNHGIYGGNTRLQLYRRMTAFLEDHLLNEPSAQPVKDSAAQ